MKLYLVDGTFEVFRCFRATPRGRNPGGQEVGATRGFFHTLASLLRAPDLSHVAIAFDSVVSRVDRRDDSDGALLRSQFPLAADVARAFGITVWPMVRVQADDALATAARRFDGDPALAGIVICSADHDFMQCVRGEGVAVLNRITKKLWTERDVVDAFGVRPEQIPDYLALVGDRSDGIPGLPGFGAKAAQTLLTRFGCLEDIPDDADAWDVSLRGKQGLASMLRERRREALLYRNLSTLRVDVPLPDTLEDLRWRGADRAKVEAVARSLDDPNLLERTLRYR
jgi:5'-3' exonuclease